MSPERILADLLAVAVLLSWVRLLRWQSGRPPGERSPSWRLATLLIAQPLCAGLLYFTFMPPPVLTAAGTLVVATRGAGPLPVLADGRGVALPEAPSLVAERVPDLGTALRRYPDTARLVVVGEGLPPRDRDAVRGMRVELRRAGTVRGLAHLALPAPVAPGSSFAVGGTVSEPGGSVELVDPAGQRVDRRSPGTDGRFVLHGTARSAGMSLFELRRRDAAGRVVERADIPLVTIGGSAPRLLLLTGAPSPETKFLRRWAADAGIDLQAQMALGGGIAVGDAPIIITRATLGRFDLAILDERSWSALGPGERASLIGAVRGGLGLLLRVTGPIPDATRGQWQALGFAVSGGSDVAPLHLGVAGADSAMLTRRILRIGSRDAASLSLDPAGPAVAPWRAEGRGRVALWPLIDTYALSLEGRGEQHAELWSRTVGTLARGRTDTWPRIQGLPRAGIRTAICNLSGDAAVLRPEGARARLVVEGGCGAFWPDRPGWHVVQPANFPFYVYPVDALPGVRAAETRDATLRLTATEASSRPAPSGRPGAAWPWFLAWLGVSAGLWWFERSGRMANRMPND